MFNYLGVTAIFYTRKYRDALKVGETGMRNITNWTELFILSFVTCFPPEFSQETNGSNSPETE